MQYHRHISALCLSLLTILLLLRSSPFAAAQAMTSPQAPLRCQVSASAAAAALSANVSSNVTVYGFPTGATCDVQVAVTSVPGVGLVFEGQGAVIDPITGTSTMDRGVIIIPETGVAMEAYAPHAQAVVTQGFFAAILETNRDPGLAISVMLTKPSFKYWGFVGHGAGGVVAANLAQTLQPKVTFLTLFAAPITADLSALNLAVVAGYSAADETLNSTAVQDSISKLPSDALVVSYSSLGHFDFADSTCKSNSTTDSGAPSLTDLVSWSLIRAAWLQATPNSLSYSNNTYLTPGSNYSKPYPVNANYTVSFSALPIPSTVPQRFWWVFTPTPIAGSASTVKAGIAYYTGTSVETRAYFQIAFEMAAYGYMVVLIESPLRASFNYFNVNGAGQLINSIDPAFNPVPKGAWVVGGHSAGAVAAAVYASEYPGTVRALVMHAGAFLPSTNFMNSSLPVLGIVGQLDGTLLVSLEEDERSFYTSTNSSVSKYVIVPGANHGGTGDYGPQPGDNFATISGDEQKRNFAAVTAAFLDPIFT